MGTRCASANVVVPPFDCIAYFGPAIPISVIATFAVMDQADMTLNILSMAGLALAIGMLVDNAVVITESIFRERAETDLSPREATLKGVREVREATEHEFSNKKAQADVSKALQAEINAYEVRRQAITQIAGARILKYLLQAKTCLIGIEDNKPEAIAAMQAAAERAGLDSSTIVPVPTIYPSGGEKQLIEILTGKQVPSHGIPANIGIVCHNVGTAHAIAGAVLEGKPLISRTCEMTSSKSSAESISG